MRQIYLTSKGNPIMISHFPGWTRYKYKYLIDKFATIKTSCPENVTIMTTMDDDSVANDKSPLIRQLKKNNIPFINCAEHKDVYPWVNNKKIELIYNGLQRINTEYCLILDGGDVTINDELTNIVEIYKTYNKDIVFNATPWAHPKVLIDLVDNRKELYGKYCFLNAGCCIGKTESLKEFYKQCLDIFKKADKNDPYWESEQYFVRKAFAKNMDKVWFDYDCKMFQIWHKTEVGLPQIDRHTGDITYRIIDSKSKKASAEKDDDQDV